MDPPVRTPEKVHSPSMRTSRKTAIAASLISAVLIAFLTFSTSSIDSADTVKILIYHSTCIAAVLVCAILTYTILTTGTVNRYRLALFIILGLIFTVSFSMELTVKYGTIVHTNTSTLKNTTPLCPIAIPFVVIPYETTGQLLFPTNLWEVAAVTCLWLAMILLLGRGWCGWICFFGWFDQFFASLAKKPRINLDTVPRWAKLFPYGLMILLVFFGIMEGLIPWILGRNPFYCAYICPLRILYDPPQVLSSLSWIIAIVVVIGGFLVFVAGPYLTKKRIHCSLICPLLPANAMIGRTSPFRVKIDADRCIKCGACVRACEVFAMEQEPGKVPVPTMECLKCGKCIDRCPKGVIEYRLTGTLVNARPWLVAIVVAFAMMLIIGFIRTIILILSTGRVA